MVSLVLLIGFAPGVTWINLSIDYLILYYYYAYYHLMQIPLVAEKLLDSFGQSVANLLKEIKEEAIRIEREDPDPERTKAHMIDRKIKMWFHQGGKLGY